MLDITRSVAYSYSVNSPLMADPESTPDCDPVRHDLAPELHLLDELRHPPQRLRPEPIRGVGALGHDLPTVLGAQVAPDGENKFVIGSGWGGVVVVILSVLRVKAVSRARSVKYF